jgi:hypothetical protein
MNTKTLITPSQGVDLVIDATAPETGLIGSYLDVSWTVTNQGSQDTNSSWYDYIFFSKDQVLEQEDSFVHSRWIWESLPLSEGETYQINSQVLLPSNLQEGEGYLIFTTDQSPLEYGNNYQAESNEDNNIKIIPFNLTVPQVDLVIDATAPETGKFSSYIDVSWTVTNQGSETAEADWSDSVYFSTDEIFDYSDRWLSGQSIYEQTPLAAGQSYTLNRSLYLPTYLQASQGYLIFTTDNSSWGSGNQLETDKTNNQKIIPFNLTFPQVDLVINATAPETGKIGSYVDVSWTVTNQGLDTSDANWIDSVYFSTDEFLNDGDTYIIGEFTGEQVPLASGSSYTINKRAYLNNNLPAGQGYLLFAADAYNYQSETNNENNTKAIPFNLSIPQVDLQVSAAMAQAKYSDLELTLSMNCTVSNVGQDTAHGSSMQFWYDSFYLSDNPTLESGVDRWLGSTWVADKLPLTSGDSYTDRMSVDLTDITAGNYYLLVEVDTYNNQVETDKTNNVFAVPVTIPDTPILGTSKAERLTGTDQDDTLIGLQGRDTLTGGAGSDRFVYTSIVDGVDVITDFEVGKDVIVLSKVLESLGYQGSSNPIEDQYIHFLGRGNDVLIKIDPDGLGDALSHNFLKIENVSVAELNNLNNFEF